jgi:pyruvate,orthophosphate dikinase
MLARDPFVTIDAEGVGEMIKLACERGRARINPSSSAFVASMAAIRRPFAFCESVGLDYVSCSPFRVPIARLAALPQARA